MCALTYSGLKFKRFSQRKTGEREKEMACVTDHGEQISVRRERDGWIDGDFLLLFLFLFLRLRLRLRLLLLLLLLS